MWQALGHIDLAFVSICGFNVPRDIHRSNTVTQKMVLCKSTWLHHFVSAKDVRTSAAQANKFKSILLCRNVLSYQACATFRGTSRSDLPQEAVIRRSRNNRGGRTSIVTSAALHLLPATTVQGVWTALIIAAAAGLWSERTRY